MFKFKELLAKQPKRGFPAYVVLLCILTAIYLAIEVPFATYLVELMGGNPTHEEVERVEHAGRLISGFALALAFWSFQLPRLLKREKNIPGIMLACFVSAGLIVPAVYFGEKALVDRIAYSATASDKQQAARLVAAREALFHPQAIEGLESAVSQDGPTWDAFRSLFGFLAFFDRDILDRIPEGSDAIELAIARGIPTQLEFRNEVLPDLLEAYRKSYEPYKRLSDAHGEAMTSLHRRIEEGWNDHRRYMAQAGGRRAREMVISRGVPVPDNWSPNDKTTFVRAAASEKLPQIDDKFQSGIDEIFGKGSFVTPGKSGYSTFINSDQIQALIAEDLALAGKPPFAITTSTSDANLVRLYRLHHSGYQRDLKAAYGDDPSIFTTGKRFGLVGEEAVRSVVAPMLALTLSLVGAFGHLFKLANYGVVLLLHFRKSRFGLTRLLRTNSLVRLPILGAAAFFAATTAYAPATEVTGTALYQRAVDSWTERAGEPLAKGIEMTISLQNWVSPTSTAFKYAGLFSPVEAYLDEGGAAFMPAFAMMPEAVTSAIPVAMAPPPVSGAIYGTISVDGIDSLMQLPRARPER